MTPTDRQRQEDDAESARVKSIADKLGEEFDAVVILCTRHEGSRGTRTIAKGSGNWHAQYGIVREWLVTSDANTTRATCNPQDTP